MEYDGDFRHCMCCQTCWAFSHSIEDGFTCRIGMFDKNRPGDVSSDRLRYQYSVYDRDLLATWKCEYRYTRQEVETMKAGRFRDIQVTKEVGEKVMEKVSSVKGNEID